MSREQRPQGTPRWFVGVLVGALIVVVLRPGAGGPPSAFAEMAIDKGGYTMMTTDGGNDEVLVVIDSRAEMVMVYRAAPNGGLDLLEREDLSSLFARAKTQALGRP